MFSCSHQQTDFLIQPARKLLMLIEIKYFDFNINFMAKLFFII